MNKLMIVALTGLVSVAAVTPALALGPLDFEAGLALNSKYVWRGMVANPDPVLQPSVGLSVVGFSAGFWGNIDTNNVNETPNADTEWAFTEVDWMLGYGLSLPLLDFNAGLIYYSFPAFDAPSTTELYLGAALNVLLSPSLTIYQDVDQIKGAYWEASINHSVALSPGSELNLGAGIGLGSKGYIEGYFGPASLLPNVPEVPGNASMTDYYISAGVPFHPLPFFTVTPSLTYTALAGDVKDIVDASDGGAYHGDSDAFLWGVNAVFSF